MNKYLRIRFATSIVLIVAALVTLSGCIQNCTVNLAKYERNSDSFKFLRVYTNIYTEKTEDLDHLQSFWNKRDSIILSPAVLGMSNSGGEYERKGTHSVMPMNFELPPTDDQIISLTRVDLDSVIITPGEFYLNAHRSLNYYHEIEVPGKTVDALLSEAFAACAETMAKFAETQIKDSGKPDAAIQTWDDLRRVILKELLDNGISGESPKQGSTTGTKIFPLESASLRMFISAGVEKTLKFHRDRDEVAFIIPLSERDCNEVVATLDLIKDALAEKGKSQNGFKAFEKEFNDLLAILKVRHVADVGLEVSGNIAKLFCASQYDLDPQPDAKKLLEYKMTVASIQGRGIKINKGLSIRDLVAKYTDK